MLTQTLRAFIQIEHVILFLLWAMPETQGKNRVLATGTIILKLSIHFTGGEEGSNVYNHVCIVRVLPEGHCILY